MKSVSLSELVRAYFRATYSGSDTRNTLSDPIAEDGEGPDPDLVALGGDRLLSILEERIKIENSPYQFIKLLVSPNADSIILSLPADEVGKPMFARMLEIAPEYSIVHENYATWLMAYHSDDPKIVAVAACHYEVASLLCLKKSNEYKLWAEEAFREVIDYGKEDAVGYLGEVRKLIISLYLK